MKNRGAYGVKSGQQLPHTLGARLRRVRIAWGWTQTRFAEALGTNQRLVSHWERDIAKPSQAAMAAVASMLGLEPEALLTGKDFTIPDLPDKGKGAVCHLPEGVIGQVVFVDGSDLPEKAIPFEEAIKVLKRLKGAGRRVWLIAESASK